MSLKQGKNYFLVPSGTYEMIMERKSNAMEQPETKRYKSDQEMKDVVEQTCVLIKRYSNAQRKWKLLAKI